jgi:hypothetical protein
LPANAEWVEIVTAPALFLRNLAEAARGDLEIAQDSLGRGHELAAPRP